jgi:hypothetical protein
MTGLNPERALHSNIFVTLVSSTSNDWVQRQRLLLLISWNCSGGESQMGNSWEAILGDFSD